MGTDRIYQNIAANFALPANDEDSDHLNAAHSGDIMNFPLYIGSLKTHDQTVKLQDRLMVPFRMQKILKIILP